MKLADVALHARLLEIQAFVTDMFAGGGTEQLAVFDCPAGGTPVAAIPVVHP